MSYDEKLLSKHDTYVSFDVEILKVERVLPNVDTNDRDEIEERVLVGSGGDFKALSRWVNALWNIADISHLFLSDDMEMTHEPAPARALDSGRGSVEFLLQIIKATESLVNCILKRAILQFATMTLALACSRCEVLPEERVINMACPIRFSCEKYCN